MSYCLYQAQAMPQAHLSERFHMNKRQFKAARSLYRYYLANHGENKFTRNFDRTFGNTTGMVTFCNSGCGYSFPFSFIFKEKYRFTNAQRVVDFNYKLGRIN